MSRGRRSYYITAEALKMLQTGRKGASTVMAGSPPFKDRYKKAIAITDAIDDLVEDLTGDREMFWEKGHGQE